MTNCIRKSLCHLPYLAISPSLRGRTQEAERQINFPLEIVFVQKSSQTLAFSTDLRVKWHVFAQLLFPAFRFSFFRVLSHMAIDIVSKHSTRLHLRETCQLASQCSPASLNYHVFSGLQRRHFWIYCDSYCTEMPQKEKSYTVRGIVYPEHRTFSACQHFPGHRERVYVQRAEVELTAAYDGDFHLFFIFTHHQSLGNNQVIFSGNFFIENPSVIILNCMVSQNFQDLTSELTFLQNFNLVLFCFFVVVCGKEKGRKNKNRLNSGVYEIFYFFVCPFI